MVELFKLSWLKNNVTHHHSTRYKDFKYWKNHSNHACLMVLEPVWSRLKKWAGSETMHVLHYYDVADMKNVFAQHHSDVAETGATAGARVELYKKTGRLRNHGSATSY